MFPHREKINSRNDGVNEFSLRYKYKQLQSSKKQTNKVTKSNK